MKNILSTVVVYLMLTSSSAVVGQSVMLKGGFNFSTMMKKNDDQKLSSDYKLLPGIHLGMGLAIPLGEIVSIRPGLLFSTRGYRIDQYDDNSGYGYYTKGKVTLYYLDIPVLLDAAFTAGSIKIYGQAGPSFGIGLAGKNNYDVSKVSYLSYYENTVKDKIEWGSDAQKNDYKRMDIGVLFGSGIELKSFRIGLYYTAGLSNLSPRTTNGLKIKNRVLGLSAGYRIGGNKN